MRYMLDTNILIYLMKNKPAAVAERVNALGADEELHMSFFTYAELLKSAERSFRKVEVLRNLEQLIRQTPVCWAADRRLCGHYARRFTELKAADTPVGANDFWIAFHALAEDAVLVTNNTREFQRIAGLAVEDWSGSRDRN